MQSAVSVCIFRELISGVSLVKKSRVILCNGNADALRPNVIFAVTGKHLKQRKRAVVQILEGVNRVTTGVIACVGRIDVAAGIRGTEPDLIRDPLVKLEAVPFHIPVVRSLSDRHCARHILIHSSQSLRISVVFHLIDALGIGGVDRIGACIAPIGACRLAHLGGLGAALGDKHENITGLALRKNITSSSLDLGHFNAAERKCWTISWTIGLEKWV